MNQKTFKQVQPTKKLKRLRIAMGIVSTILIATIVFAIQNARSNKNIQTDNTKTPNQKTVSTIVVGEYQHNETLETAGVVTAKTKIDVVALGSGTVRTLHFDVGDSVFQNQQLVQLHDSATLTNFETSRINYDNLASSLGATQNITDESVNLANLSLKQTQESVASAEIALRTAQNNDETTLPVHTQQLKKAKQDAIVVFHTNLQTAQDALDDINFIIKAEGFNQLENISSTLGINDKAALERARTNWKLTKTSYSTLVLQVVTEKNINLQLAELIDLLDLTLSAATDTVATLQATTYNLAFSEEALTQERSKMSSLKTTVANAKAVATKSLNALDTLPNTQAKEQIALLNAVDAAENNLALAKIAHQAAISQVSNSENNKNQQLIGSRTTLDNARGQRNLATQAVADLSVRAPIAGEITERFIEIGTKLSPGQKVAEISQTDLVAIEVGLSQVNAARVRVGDVVSIEDKYEGVISTIDPAADPVSRKITIEIVFDNSQQELIPETFVTIKIPLTNIEFDTTKPVENAETFLIPLKAITITNSERFVYIVNKDKAQKVTVETGNVSSRQIEITNGLAFGDILIVEGNKRLEDGDLIKANEYAEQ
jgi:RND family efflux transporter MFP subunit